MPEERPREEGAEAAWRRRAAEQTGTVARKAVAGHAAAGGGEEDRESPLSPPMCTTTPSEVTVKETATGAAAVAVRGEAGKQVWGRARERGQRGEWGRGSC